MEIAEDGFGLNDFLLLGVVFLTRYGGKDRIFQEQIGDGIPYWQRGLEHW